MMNLRRPGACSVCAVALDAGTNAEWDAERKVVTCAPCVARREASAVVPPEIDRGIAGGSARSEHDRRHDKRERKIEEKWGTGRVGRFVKFATEDPQSTKAWATGALGEERVAQVLESHLGERGVVLHDRKVPGTRGNIDHILIASSGVWVIDAKQYRGKVERRDVGGLFRPEARLYVGGRDCSKAVDGLAWQVEAVRTASARSGVPVHACLSFVGAEWPSFFAKPFRLKDVWISWPSKLAELAAAPGPLVPGDVDAIARLLAVKLPSKAR